MNNNQLDKIMESWKEQRSPKDTQFATEEKFTADFFEKAAELPVEKTAKKTFWPIVCKLAACVAVVLCISFVLLKLNRTKEKDTLRGMSIAKVSQNESIEEMNPQGEEADEAVADMVAAKPVMAMAKSKSKLADSESGLMLKPSQPTSLPVTAPVANAPIVVNDDAIALDGNGELRVLGTKQIGNMNITGLDGNIVMNDGYLVDYGYNKAKKESAGNDVLTDDDIANITNDNYNTANEYVANKVLESHALDFSVTNTGGNVDITSFGTALSVDGESLVENANVAANVMQKVEFDFGDRTAIKSETADVAGRDAADIVGDTSSIAADIAYLENTFALYYDGKDLAVRKRRMTVPSSSNTEEYKNVSEKPFLTVSANPLSTFGADVDTAGYGMVRRMILQENRLPVANAIRIEEMINYFHYDYPMPEKDEMMRPNFEMQAAPWNLSHQLLLVGVQAKTIPVEELPSSHYVFLIDNSGSMSHVFPMVKDAMTALAKQLRKGDSVSMVTYGGGVNVLLEAAWDPEVVCAEIAKLQAGGFTPGGEGIQKAYQIAEQHFIKGGNNRIVLITDGDFNVGTSSEAELVQMVE
ncbi:MAG: von Willebrand factor type A domain-containing protein, partial [Victivallales bacterium]|nr:von Willebrand factor type A domain-containing protein [Victivallales bacterium]